MNARPLLIVAAIAYGVCGTCHGSDFAAYHAVPDARLDTIRGGFDFGDNLRASFALERTVLVNGVEAIRTSVTIPNVAQMSIDQANALANALRTTVVTNGVGGVTTDPIASGAQMPVSAAAASAPTAQGVAPPPNVTTAMLPIGSGPGLVVQNALDNQAITATTTIDASVNTSRMLQNMRLDESIRDAVIQFRGN